MDEQPKTAQKRRTRVDPFLDWLRQHREDRGRMADLRHGLSKATEYRAWPHVAPWLGDRFSNDKARAILIVIGAAFAMQCDLQTGGGGLDMGGVLRRVALGKGGGAGGLEGLATFDARFRRLLSCDSAEEVCEHLPGIIRAATRATPPVVIDLSRLYQDLTYWGDRVKLRWAQSYWAVQGEEATS